MKGVNKCIVLGNLGKDPEPLRTAGRSVTTTLTVATTDTWTDKNGDRKEDTEWHRVVLWNKLAELACQYLRKGRQVYIEGKKKTRSWEDENGKHYITEIIADNMQMLGGPGMPAPDEGKQE